MPTGPRWSQTTSRRTNTASQTERVGLKPTKRLGLKLTKNIISAWQGNIMDLMYHDCSPEDSWAEYDAQGIYLTRVCDVCRKAKLSKYRPEILTGYNQSDVDEYIEPDYYDDRDMTGQDSCDGSTPDADMPRWEY